MALPVEQKVLTVANNDTDINAAITTEAASDWLVSFMIVSGSDMVILFQRTVTAS
jgi:hypothetical protein